MRSRPATSRPEVQFSSLCDVAGCGSVVAVEALLVVSRVPDGPASVVPLGAPGGREWGAKRRTSRNPGCCHPAGGLGCRLTLVVEVLCPDAAGGWRRRFPYVVLRRVAPVLDEFVLRLTPRRGALSSVLPVMVSLLVMTCRSCGG